MGGAQKRGLPEQIDLTFRCWTPCYGHLVELNCTGALFSRTVIGELDEHQQGDRARLLEFLQLPLADFSRWGGARRRRLRPWQPGPAAGFGPSAAIDGLLPT